MVDSVTKQEFVERVRDTRERWEAAIQCIPKHRMIKPWFCGEWSLKGVIAHIAWYEQEMIRMLQSKQFGGSELWLHSLEERNDAIYEEFGGRSLDAVLEEAEATYAQLGSFLAGLEEEGFNDPARFPGMPTTWKPWQVLASNTYEHYEDHLRQAEAWRVAE